MGFRIVPLRWPSTFYIILYIIKTRALARVLFKCNKTNEENLSIKLLDKKYQNDIIK